MFLSGSGLSTGLSVSDGSWQCAMDGEDEVMCSEVYIGLRVMNCDAFSTALIYTSHMQEPGTPDNKPLV